MSVQTEMPNLINEVRGPTFPGRLQGNCLGIKLRAIRKVYCENFNYNFLQKTGFLRSHYVPKD